MASEGAARFGIDQPGGGPETTRLRETLCEAWGGFAQGALPGSGRSSARDVLLFAGLEGPQVRLAHGLV